MRHDYQSIGEQILNGVFKAVYILFLPFYGAYLLLKWFIVSVFKETGSKLVKIVGGALAISIIALVVQYFA